MGKISSDLLIVENGRDRGEAIARMAKAAGHKVLRVRPYCGEPLAQGLWPRTIILTGGPGSVRDLRHPDNLFLAGVLAFTKVAIERRTPVIGICLGHQLIARALNGRVLRQQRMEIGVRRICPTEAHGSESRTESLLGSAPSWAAMGLWGWWAAKRSAPEPTRATARRVPTTLSGPIAVNGDVIDEGVPQSGGGFRAFVFHRDYVPEPPPGCIVTYRSERCAVEGFSHIDRPVHGFQFHPEIASPQAKSIMKWWYRENLMFQRDLSDAAAFDANPAHRCLLTLIERCVLEGKE